MTKKWVTDYEIDILKAIVLEYSRIDCRYALENTNTLSEAIDWLKSKFRI